MGGGRLEGSQGEEAMIAHGITGGEKEGDRELETGVGSGSGRGNKTRGIGERCGRGNRKRELGRDRGGREALGNLQGGSLGPLGVLLGASRGIPRPF